MGPDRPQPARPRELNLFLVIVVLGFTVAAAVAAWMYFVAPVLLS